MSEREILDSWKEISAFLKRGVRTCQRWERELDLPVHRLDGSPKARVFAYKEELEGWLKQKSRERERRRIRVMAASSVVLIVAVAGFLIWRYVVHPPVPSLPHGMPTLAVLYFENKSGDAKLDNWREALAELLIEDLSQSKYIRVISGEDIYTILKRLGLAAARKYSSEDIAKIAAQTKATHILRGSYIKAGESYIITAGLQRPHSGESFTPLRLEASNEKDIIVKADDLALQVKEGLNLTAVQISSDIDKEAGKITTSSPEAFKYYVEGRKCLWEADQERTVSYIEKAIEIDPEFAMAYRTLGIVRFNSGQEAEGRKYLKKALELSARLPENQRLIIEGDIFYHDQDYVKAIEVGKRLVKAYPGNTTGYSLLYAAYEGANDFDHAIDDQELVVQIQRKPLSIYNLALCYSAKGLYQKAEGLCRSYMQDAEDNIALREALTFLYLWQRKFDLALAEAKQRAFLLGVIKSQYTNIGFIGDVLLLKGDFSGAEKAYQQGFQRNRVGGRYLLAQLALIQGKYSEALTLMQQNLGESKGNKEKEADAYGNLAAALERAGRYENAYKAFGRYLELSAQCRKSTEEAELPYLPSQQKSDLFAKGRIQAELGALDKAKWTAEELKALIGKGINKKELRYYEYILGLIEFGKRDYRKAADCLGRACGGIDFESTYANDYALFFDGWARSLYESGDLGKARRNYDKITLLTTNRLSYGDIYAKAFYMLGKIAEQTGDKVKARENYQKFLDLWKNADPGLPEVGDAGQRLADLKGS